MPHSSEAVSQAATPSQGASAQSVRAPEDIGSVVRRLELELQRGRRRKWIRWGVVAALGSALFFGFAAYKKANAPPLEPQFTTAALETRDVIEEVQSTGVVEPVNQVEVGAQVSGRVVSVDVDFNSTVTAGQQLAEIDSELFGAEVVQQNAQLSAARAAVAAAEARRDAIRTRLDRSRTLVAQEVASAAELDQAQGEYDVAVAEVATAQSQIAQIQARLTSARTTLTYTKIYSPIEGVVIDRQIEPGQTVASSFSTPVLFVIARDLSEMRVKAEIDEADVGKVKEGMKAEVTVDAFPDDKFEGSLTQIRLSPNNVEGVVTYSAVILVKNPDGKLRPGMTAVAKVVTRQSKQVLAVRNSALRFEPLAADEDKDKQDGAAVKKSKPSPGQAPSKKPGAGEGLVYLTAGGPVDNPGVTQKIVKLGISDGVWTEIKGGLPAHAEVIVDEKPTETAKGFRLF